MENKQELEQMLYAMRLHDKLTFDGFNVLRVNKGWIYIFSKKVHCNGVGDQVAMSSVFVPK